MSIIKDLTFNGRTVSSFKLQVGDSSEWWTTPERDIEHISVPGRSGDLLIDNGRFNNMELTFEINKVKSGGSFMELANFLASEPGYHKLTISDDTSHYRLASFESMMQPTFGQMRRTGRASISFNCQPQRFVTEDEAGLPFGISEDGVEDFIIMGSFPSKPLFVFDNPKGTDSGIHYSRLSIDGLPSDSTTTRETFTFDVSGSTDMDQIAIDSESLEIYGIKGGKRQTIRPTVVDVEGGGEYFGDNRGFPVFRAGFTYFLRTYTSGSAELRATGTVYPRRWVL